MALNTSDIQSGTELRIYSATVIFHVAGSGEVTIETKKIGAPESHYAQRSDKLTATDSYTEELFDSDIRITKDETVNLSLSAKSGATWEEI